MLFFFLIFLVKKSSYLPKLDLFLFARNSSYGICDIQNLALIKLEIIATFDLLIWEFV